jgi:hypothetical protein
MTSENKKWEDIKADYLQKVEKALSSVKNHRKKEVLDDVSAHLDRRFEELEEDNQTWENFQSIITEMGPPSDYAELLEPNAPSAIKKSNKKNALFIAAVAIVIIVCIILLNVLPLEPKPISPERFRDGFFEKHDSFDIDSATLSDVKKVFGEPKEYVWGNQTLNREDLPRRFVIIYPDSFCVFMAEDKVVELRHEGPETEYAWKGKICVGDSIEHVMEVVGEPTQIITGEKNRFKDKVLYRDIEGREGHCYYARHDQDVRLWFADYKVIAIYITRSDYGDGRELKEVRSETNTIISWERVGDYTFDMSKDDVLEKLGEPETIFYGKKRYALDNLPRMYYMHFGDVSFRILDNSVEEITAHSPFYKFANGLGVGDSEQKIKQAFGDDFHLKETEWKDFLSYKNKGLVFEIDKNNRTVMEIGVLKGSIYD